VLRVTDDGIGLSAEDQRQVFTVRLPLQAAMAG
jgi:signal transduction histidine kinase